MKVCLIAAPLTARSGVYRSTLETVSAARGAGLEWSAVVGIRPEAGAVTLPEDLQEHVVEFTTDVRSIGTVKHLRATFAEIRQIQEADILISLIPQSDMALSTARGYSKPWVSYIRGLPWPEKSEKSLPIRLVRRTAETIALKSAAEVWATTQVLADQVAPLIRPVLVPAGIADMPRRFDGASSHGHLLWAGRLVSEKQPDLFMEIAESVQHPGVLYGEGPMQEELLQRNASYTEIRPWTQPERLWDGAGMYLGTSRREAFGRSVVEAALLGLPVVLSKDYGATPFLFTDPELSRRFVLPSDDAAAWQSAVQELLTDEELRRHVSNHLHESAKKLTIGRSVQAMSGRLQKIL